MENKMISEYLAGLRKEGNEYYDIYEILEDYARLVDHLTNSPYNDIPEELEFDMEIWLKLESIKNILEMGSDSDEGGGKRFIEEMNRLDDEFMKITIPVVAPAGLPWWYYRVLKRAGAGYAEEIKSKYGVYIEIFE